MFTQRLCEGEDPEIFFPDGRGNRDERVEVAQAICRKCPALRICAADALRLGITHGIVASVDLGYLSDRVDRSRQSQLEAIAAGYVPRGVRKSG
ncbi:WhiB family transcriptional regulator [Nocardia brasiliensis]|uniref:WhiB family transcriptional regulator n=1 Tax=Nocardia brasiliensis TaxID=37326 RepID=UPI0005A91719|nr:WhiB family transcriptional regulator [Nocardia brasiliensis]ASF08993.1 WhiB family transcriptional regulator [Nocardia brasiliensis]